MQAQCATLKTFISVAHLFHSQSESENEQAILLLVPIHENSILFHRNTTANTGEYHHKAETVKQTAASTEKTRLFFRITCFYNPILTEATRVIQDFLIQH